MMRRDNEYNASVRIVQETISFLNCKSFWRSLIQGLEDKEGRDLAAMTSAIQSLKEVQPALEKRDQKIRERITNITSDPRSSSLTEKEQTYVNSVTEYAFDEETKIESGPFDGEIAGLIRKLENVADGGGW
jgi:hypothetical protein